MCLHNLCCFTMLLELRHHFAFFGFAAVAALSNALRAIFRTHLHDACFNTQFSKIHTVWCFKQAVVSWNTGVRTCIEKISCSTILHLCMTSPQAANLLCGAYASGVCTDGGSHKIHKLPAMTRSICHHLLSRPNIMMRKAMVSSLQHVLPLTQALL